MDIKIIKATPTDVEQIEAKNNESVEPQQTLESSDSDQISSIAVKQALEIAHGDLDYDNDVKILVKWAKSQVEGDDPIAIKWAIRDLAHRLGTPTYGDRIKHVARFAYLDMEEKRIKSEKRKFI